MGDVAMTVPVIRAMVEQHLTVKITVVSRPFFKPFFDGIPNVEFFAVDVKKRHKGFFGLLKLYSDLQQLNIDAVADLHNVLRSQIIRTLFSLSGKKVAATDKGRAEKKALTRAENKVFQPVKTMVERHVETFKKLGFSVDLSLPNFPEKAILSEEILSISGKKDNFKWIGIAPFAQYESKVYPLDLMQKVIDLLAENTQYKIFLFGGGNEEIEKLNILAKQRENCIVVAGKLKFNQELQFISNLDVMLSMDSGNAHIASMLGIKVITLWGATHPFAGFAPFNQPLENCLTADRNQYPLLPTSVYGNKKVAGYEEIMRSISVESVVEKVNLELNH
ncbi:glycosyltransferase family 9 protein [Flavobacterium dankookense]|uniref:ADP-heptose:LPS heptosyltransferase n=1 Tax=Flavobacterium dankookense TaxID=706186 RepID=A0A4R6QC81_9FLAO|nr:glycosyltransferase family 9 protein [Flavobacterium dankookense]TDP60011.1 ADP-heptose:LPS heptosyltransferase [Flavobacterium dankookense]